MLKTPKISPQVIIIGQKNELNLESFGYHLKPFNLSIN